jgi:hypothetical protein
VSGATTLAGGATVTNGLTADNANIIGTLTAGNAAIAGTLTVTSLQFTNGYNVAAAPGSTTTIGSYSSPTQILGSSTTIDSATGGTSVSGTNLNGTGVTIQGHGSNGTDVAILSGNGNSYLKLSGGSAALTGAQSTTISGGTSGLTLNNSGARLSGPSGTPVRLSGIADGSSPNDAVNRRQLDLAYAGVAGAMAMASLPSPAFGNRYSIGMAGATYQGQNGMAAGIKANIPVQEDRNLQLVGGVNYMGGGQLGASVGVGYSW